MAAVVDDDDDPKGSDYEKKYDNPLEDGAEGTAMDRAKLDEHDVELSQMFVELKKAAFGEVDLDEYDEFAVEEHLKDKWHGILHPDMPARKTYDMVQLLVMLYLGYLLPVRLAFTQTASGPIEVAVDLIIDASVWLDMYLQMRMCYYDPKTKKLITDTARIKHEYKHSWFLVDFFSVVPADQVLLMVGTIMVEHSSNAKVTDVGIGLLDYSVTFRLMRLLRLVRLAKLKRMFDIDKVVHSIYVLVKGLDMTKLEVSFNFRIIFLILLIFSSCHFLGCIWLLIGRHNVLEQQNPSGWMVDAYEQETVNKTKDYISCIGGSFDATAWNAKHGSNCTGYKCAPIPEQNPYDVDCSWIESRRDTLGGTGFAKGIGASQHEQYLSAVYFTLVTMTTVGYGDILPESQGEKEFVMACIIFGAFLCKYLPFFV